MFLKANKVQTVGTVREFLNPTKEGKINVSDAVISVASAAPYAAIPFLIPSLAGFNPTGGGLMQPIWAQAASSVPAASMKQEVSQKIIEAFQPIIDLVQGLAYPICFISVSIAGIKWMLKDQEGALRTLQGSAMGFVIVQMSPLIMKLLVSVTAGS